jgi:hypothetical protein
MACVLLACPKKQAANADAGPEDSGAAAVVEAAAPSLAANESAVTRYPDESAVNNTAQTVRWPVANVRTQASAAGGDLVAAVKGGTEVQKIAEHQSYALVVFNDPTDSSKKDMGWVSDAVFSAEPAHKRTPAHCAGGQAAILLPSGEETCVVTCTQDSTCPKGEVCNGSGVLSVNGAAGAATKFCGPHAAAADAGAAPAPTKLLDAHKEGTQCPVGYGPCGPVMCRLQCTKDADCGGGGAHCQGGYCVGRDKAPCAK